MNIGERIKLIREEKHLSQEALAKLLNTDANNVWRWENGTMPRSLNKIAKALNVSMSYLLGEEEDVMVAGRTLEFYGVVRLPVTDLSECNSDKGYYKGGKRLNDWLYLTYDKIGPMEPKRPFAVRCSTPGMAPSLNVNDVVVINPNIEPRAGEFCLARLVDASVIKFYTPMPDGGCVLRSSEGTGVPPLIFSAADVDKGVKIIGRVVYIDRGMKV